MSKERKKQKPSIGGLVGRSKGGKIENCHSEGKITINGKPKDINIGGLVGQSENTEIINSSSKVKVHFRHYGTFFHKTATLFNEHRIVSILGLVVAIAAIIVPIWVSHLPPTPPNVTVSPSSNPIINSGSTVDIGITATPLFKPPYRNDVWVTIYNENSRKCYMVLEFATSDGFNFLPVSNLPENFSAEEGYEYKNVMKVYIKDFPPEFTYRVNLPVYTLNPTLGGTELISYRVLKSQYEN